MFNRCLDHDNLYFTCYTSVLTILEVEESDLGVYSCNFSYHDGVLEHRYRYGEPYAVSNISLITEDTEPSLSEGLVYNQGGIFYRHSRLPAESFGQCMIYGAKNITWYVALKSMKGSFGKPLNVSVLHRSDKWQDFSNISIFQYHPYSDVTESFIVMSTGVNSKDFQLGCYLNNSGTTIHNNDNVIFIELSSSYYYDYIDGYSVTAKSHCYRDCYYACCSCCGSIN